MKQVVRNKSSYPSASRDLASKCYMHVDQKLLQLLLCYLEDLCKVDILVTAPVAALAPLSGWVCYAGYTVHDPCNCLSAHL